MSRLLDAEATEKKYPHSLIELGRIYANGTLGKRQTNIFKKLLSLVKKER